MEEHPDHVRAIGMISIELNNLESFLGRLLAEILQVSPGVAQAIYWKPQGASVRLGILKAAAETTYKPRFTTLSDDPTILTLEQEINETLKGFLERTLKIHKRAHDATLARHSIMHDVWGSDNDTGKVARSKTNAREPHKIVPIKELTDLIDRMRILVDDIRELTRDLVVHHLPPYTLPA